MKALVTGATGFVGSHLVDLLLDEGLDVVAQVRETSRLTWLEGLDIDLRTADLRDRDTLPELVEDADLVFHVAALLRGRTEQEYNEVNLEGTRNLLDAVERSGPKDARFVFVSTLAAVGPNPDTQPVDEATPARPINYYGSSKLAAERLVLEAGERMPVTIVRPPAVYGPRDETFRPLFGMARRLGIAPVIGDPQKQLTLVHVDDLVRCLWLAATEESALGQAFFVGSGTHAWVEVISALEAGLGQRVRPVRIPNIIARLFGEFGELKWTLTGKSQVICRRKIRDLLQPRWTCSWQKAKDQLGYAPAVDLANGMQSTLDWYTENGWIRPPKGSRAD